MIWVWKDEYKITPQRHGEEMYLIQRPTYISLRYERNVLKEPSLGRSNWGCLWEFKVIKALNVFQEF